MLFLESKYFGLEFIVFLDYFLIFGSIFIDDCSLLGYFLFKYFDYSLFGL